MSDGAVLVFARRPERGSVKTRLADCLGKSLTLTLYEAFLRDTLFAARQSGAKVLLAHTPGPHFYEQDLADTSFEQRGTSFGERFDSALEDAANQLPRGTPLILIGADTPHLSPNSLRLALDALRETKAVVGPTANGGFYLLGFSARPVPVAEVFSYPSFREVREIVRLLIEASVKPKVLEFWFDVDLPEDVARLSFYIDVLEAVGAEWIPNHTRTVLRDQGIVPSVFKEQDGERSAPGRTTLASSSLVLRD